MIPGQVENFLQIIDVDGMPLTQIPFGVRLFANTSKYRL